MADDEDDEFDGATEPDGDRDGDDRDDGDDEDGDEDDTEVEVPEEVHTVCHLCGGAGMIADPKFAIVGGVPRSVDNGRQCPECDNEGHFAGIIPPL